MLALSSQISGVAQNIHPALKTTASKLQMDADHFSMTRLDGDIAAITQYLDLCVLAAKQGDENIPKDINAKALFSILGLDTLKSVGNSSKELDNAWLNHSYIENGGSDKGLFSFLGDAPQDFIAPTICPAGTDFAIQVKMDLREFVPMVLKIAKLSGQDAVAAQMEQMVPDLNMSPLELFSKLDFTVSLALDINTDENAQTNPLAIISGANGIMRIDGLNWLWEKVGDRLIAQSKIPFEKSEEGGVITYTVPAEMRKEMLGYSPQLIIDKANGHIWVSSKPEFYTACKAGKNTLAQSPEFKAAMEHLPTKGNSLMYLSKGLLKTSKSQFDNAVATKMFGDEFEKAKEIGSRLMVDITGSDKGWAMTLTKDADGVLISSRGPIGLHHLKYLTPVIPMLWLGKRNTAVSVPPLNLPAPTSE